MGQESSGGYSSGWNDGHIRSNVLNRMKIVHMVDTGSGQVCSITCILHVALTKAAMDLDGGGSVLDDE